MRMILAALSVCFTLSAFAESSSVKCDLYRPGFEIFSYISKYKSITEASVMISFSSAGMNGYLRATDVSVDYCQDEVITAFKSNIFSNQVVSILMPAEIFSSDINVPFNAYVKTVSQDMGEISQATCYLIK